jgi:hypothetical protein
MLVDRVESDNAGALCVMSHKPKAIRNHIDRQ